MAFRATAVLAFVLLAGAGSVTAQDNILDAAATIDDLSILVAAVNASSLADAASDPNANVTVFAPTNEAFAAALELLDITAENLLANTSLLDYYLSYHIIAEPLSSADLSDGLELPTLLENSNVTIGVSDDGVTVSGLNTANVTMADIKVGNSYVHIIDAVLLPPSDDE